ESTAGPAFAIGLLAQIEREPLDRRQPQFGQDQVQPGIHGRAHACTPSDVSKPARSGNSTFTLGNTPGSGASSSVSAIRSGNWSSSTSCSSSVASCASCVGADRKLSHL